MLLMSHQMAKDQEHVRVIGRFLWEQVRGWMMRQTASILHLESFKHG